MHRGQTKLFFEELLTLCRKHNVNIELDGKFNFYLDEDHNMIEFEHVEVTGAWNIRKDSAALTATRINRPALTEELEIFGMGEVEDKEEDYAFE